MSFELPFDDFVCACACASLSLPLSAPHRCFILRITLPCYSAGYLTRRVSAGDLVCLWEFWTCLLDFWSCLLDHSLILDYCRASDHSLILWSKKHKIISRQHTHAASIMTTAPTHTRRRRPTPAPTPVPTPVPACPHANIHANANANARADATCEVGERIHVNCGGNVCDGTANRG